MFFLLQPHRALLSDANANLIDVWRHVQSDPQQVHHWATHLELTAENYYATRSQQAVDPVRRAGEFIFLNRGAFNGLYRVNRSGSFNVPWGAPRTANVVTLEALEAASTALNVGHVRLEVLDYAAAVGRTRAGDLIYLDPPYVTGHNNNGFIDYNEKLFSWKDQIRLASAAEKARQRGAWVLVSNALHSEVSKLYPGFELHELTRQSNIAGNKAKRGKTEEALFVGKPNDG